MGEGRASIRIPYVDERTANLPKCFVRVYVSPILRTYPEARSQQLEKMLPRMAVFQFLLCIRIKGEHVRRREKAKQGNL